jgi:hypothetical protein
MEFYIYPIVCMYIYKVCKYVYVYVCTSERMSHLFVASPFARASLSSSLLISCWWLRYSNSATNASAQP